MQIEESWEAAEDTAYRRLLLATTAKDGVDAWKGGFPADTMLGWIFTSGGLGVEPIARFWGTSPAWCQLPFNARVEGRFRMRAECLRLAGRIIGYLKATANLSQVGNVLTLRLADMPGEPAEVLLDNGAIVWGINIPMHLVFATSADYENE